ncbi:MAG: DDE-type integrase/transposase/recombinase, partial [Methylobacillus sp.]|nr:DDE-type integrase/transposase/recombinase [Methylobacillus sp.]
MSFVKQWYSAAEIAEMKLPGLPGTKRNMNDLADRENWPRQNRAGRGGGFEYQPPATILKLIREHTVQKMVQSAKVEHVPTTLINVPASIPTTDLKDWQRSTAEARAAICAEVKRLADIGGTTKAVKTMINLAALGRLPEHLQCLVPVANAKAGADGKRTLSRTSIYRWLAESAAGGVGKLSPKQRTTSRIPAWAPYFLGLFQQPQKPSIQYCLEKLPNILPAGVPLPSYGQASRFIKKMSNVDAQRGRMGNREIKSIRPFVRRDTTQMWPGDAYTADGHTFDAEIAHPAHGKPFRPEITTIIDVATRRAVGWSAGLAESTWAVLDALRHACINGGIAAIFYVDNGSGYKNAAMASETTGFMARLGITLSHSLPYNSQARGIIERSHKTIWVRGAKTMPTYMGAAMDCEAKQTAYKVTRADIKLVGTSRALMSWTEF